MRWYQSSAGLHSLCCGRLYPCRRARLPYPVSGAPSGRRPGCWQASGGHAPGLTRSRMRPSLMLLSRHAARPEACARLCSRPAPRPRTNAAVVLQNWWSKRRAAPLPPTQPRPRCTVKNLGMPLAAWPGGCGPRACIPKLIQTRAPCGRSHHLHRRAPGQAGSACRRGSPGWPGDGQQLPVAAAASCRLCRRPPSCASARLPQ